MAKPGRPTTDNRQSVMDLICDLIAHGKTLRMICDSVEGMPNKSTVLRWMAESEEFRDQYARARAEQADHYADEIIEIADTEPDPQVARVRIDARKWHASKTAPKKYGDRISQEISGADGAPFTIQVVRFGADDPDTK